MNRRRLILVLTAAILLIAITARLIPGPRTIDDAFITFRYSRNLVSGEGFVYNPGVRTLGTTTPLFTLVMAGAGVLGGEDSYPQAAILISAITDAVTCALLFAIARRAIPSIWVAALPGLLWAIHPMSVTFAIGGMETSVNILWMVGAVWFFTTPNRKRVHEIGLGVCAALGVLTRIDAVLWIGPLLLWQLVDSLRQRRLPLWTWGAAVIVSLPWFAFAWAYFGSPIPNSINAKTVAYLLSPGAAFIRFIQHYATPFSEFDTFGSVGAMIGAVVYLALSAFALLYVRRAQPRLISWLIYPWLYMAIFSIANPLIFRWYLAPPLPAFILSAVIGVWAIVNPIRRNAREMTQEDQRARQAVSLRTIVPVGVIALVAAVWIFTSLNAWTLHPDHGPDRPAPRMAWHAIELLYEQVGRMLYEEQGVTSETLVGSADIGAVGYFSRATIVDTVGLVTPAMRAYYPVDPALVVEGQNYAIPPQLIRDTQPEYLVTMEGFVRLGLARDPWFTQTYRVLESIPVDFYGSAMLVYERQIVP